VGVIIGDDGGLCGVCGEAPGALSSFDWKNV